MWNSAFMAKEFISVRLYEFSILLLLCELRTPFLCTSLYICGLIAFMFCSPVYCILLEGSLGKVEK